VGDERLSVVITRVEAQLRRADIAGVTIDLEILEQENERFMRTLVHAFNPETSEATSTDNNPVFNKDSQSVLKKEKLVVTVQTPD